MPSDAVTAEFERPTCRYDGNWVLRTKSKPPRSIRSEIFGPDPVRACGRRSLRSAGVVESSAEDTRRLPIDEARVGDPKAAREPGAGVWEEVICIP